MKTKTFNLPASTQKSYYGKAVVYEIGTAKFLVSYSTIVCGIVRGKFEKYWNDYSVTTQNHINDFRRLYGLESIGKKAWLEGLKTSRFNFEKYGRLNNTNDYKVVNAWY